MTDFTGTQFIRITNTVGVEISIPLLGSLEGGIALNDQQLGIYVDAQVVPSRAI